MIPSGTCGDARSTHARRSPFCGLGTRGLAIQATNDSGAGTETPLDATPNAAPSPASYRATGSAPSQRCASALVIVSKCAPLRLPGRFSFRALNAKLPFKPLQSFFLIFDVRTPDVSQESATIRRNRGAILCTLITRTAKRSQVRHVVTSAVLVVNDVADMQPDCPASIGIVRVACANPAHLTGEAVTFKHLGARLSLTSAVPNLYASGFFDGADSRRYSPGRERSIVMVRLDRPPVIAS